MSILSEAAMARTGRDLTRTVLLECQGSDQSERYLASRFQIGAQYVQWMERSFPGELKIIRFLEQQLQQKALGFSSRDDDALDANDAGCLSEGYSWCFS